jgi:AraC family transcriptional regulator
MNWQERLNAAVDYMEKHLDGEIEWNRAAGSANCSMFHFFRMFEIVSGVSPCEYVRRRRMSKAALELTSGRAKVIDLALAAGYDSPDSFVRAFKRELGLTPSEAKEPGARLKTWPRIAFSVVLKGDIPVNFRIENHEAIRMTGLPLRASCKDGINFKEIPEFWKRIMADGRCASLGESVPSGSKLGVMGVCAPDMDEKTGEFTYLVAIETPADKSKLPAGCIDFSTSAGTWAIFESRGPIPEAIQEVWKKIYSEWFPTSGYEHTDEYELEIYPDGDSISADYYCEVWIPVKKAGK